MTTCTFMNHIIFLIYRYVTRKLGKGNIDDFIFEGFLFNIGKEIKDHRLCHKTYQSDSVVVTINLYTTTFQFVVYGNFHTSEPSLLSVISLCHCTVWRWTVIVRSLAWTKCTMRMGYVQVVCTTCKQTSFVCFFIEVIFIDDVIHY